jgi:hypothetical protein
MSTSDQIKSQMQALVDEAKGHKAQRDMSTMEYKHAMKKLGMLAETYPVLAKELGIVDEKKAEEGEKKAG